MGTYFSRRKAAQPFPPEPEDTSIVASSANLSTLVRIAKNGEIMKSLGVFSGDVMERGGRLLPKKFAIGIELKD
jgi:hypothetical protein